MQSNLGGCRFNHHQASRHRSESRPSIGSQSPNLYVLHSAYAYGNINKRLGRSNNFPSFVYSFFVPHIRHVRPPRFPGTHNAKRRKMKAGNTYNTHSITEKPPRLRFQRLGRSVTCSCHYIGSHFPSSNIYCGKSRKELGRKLLLPTQSETVCNQTLLHELAYSLPLSVIPRDVYLSSSRLLQQWATSIAQELHMPTTFLLYPPSM